MIWPLFALLSLTFRPFSNPYGAFSAAWTLSMYNYNGQVGFTSVHHSVESTVPYIHSLNVTSLTYMNQVQLGSAGRILARTEYGYYTAVVDSQWITCQ